MASIYDEYAKYMRKGGAVTQSPYARDAQQGIVAPGSGGGSGSDSEPRQSGLSWALDMLSRPRYAVTGSISGNIRAGQEKSSAVEAMKSVLSGAGKGLTSTDPEDQVQGVELYDQIRKTANPDWEKSILDEVNTPGDLGAAVGRGAAGLGLDIALDPLTYTSFGVIPLVGKGLGALAKAAKPAEAVAKAAPKVAEDVAKVAPKAAPEVAAVERAVEAAAPAGAVTRAAEEVVDTAAKPLPTAQISAADLSTSRVRPGAAAPTPKLSAKSAVSAKVPKVSETIGSRAPRVVEALLKTNKALDSALAAAPKAAKAAKSPAKSAPGAPPASYAELAEKFFAGSDEVVGKLRSHSGGGAMNIFPSTIVKGLSNPDNKEVIRYLNRLGEAARNPATSSPQLVEFLQNAKAFMNARRVEQAATKPGTKAAPTPEADPIAAEMNPQRLETLRRLLRSEKGTPTPLGKELKEAVGPALFAQLTRRGGGDVARASREKAFDDLTLLARDADSVSPSTFDGMHENVRAFVEGTLQIQRKDFDAVARQKALDYATEAGKPRISNKKTARGVDPKAMSDSAKLLGASPKVLLNRAEAQAKNISGEVFEANFRGNTYFYKDAAGMQRAIKDGEINQYAYATWLHSGRNQLDDEIKAVVGEGEDYAVIKTSARRRGMPARQLADGTTSAPIMPLRDRLRTSEDVIADSGTLMHVNLDGEVVPIRPTNIYDGVEDAVSALRAAGQAKEAESLDKLIDIVLYNPGTAGPDTVLLEMFAAAQAGKADDVLLKIAATNSSKYTKLGFDKRQQFSSTGGRSRFATFTAAELRQSAVSLVRQTQESVAARMGNYARDYFQKTTTDASAIGSVLEKEAAEALAKSEGHLLAMYGGIEKRLPELSIEFGASPHAIGLAAENLSKQLPTWLMRQSRSVTSTQTAYRNAANAGKTVPEMRAAGVVSEMKHTPVAVNAAIDEADDLIEVAAQVAGESQGLGSKAMSVLEVELASSNLLQKFVHPLRKTFDENYGAIAEGIKFRDFLRYHTGGSGKDIVYRGRDITAWSKKHSKVPFVTNAGEESAETVASVAFKSLQGGVTRLPDAQLATQQGQHVQQALDELQGIANYYFDVPGASLHGDMYWRSGAQNVVYLEDAMRGAGLEKYLPALEEAMVKGDISAWWRNVDIADPADFLHRYNTAVHSAMSHRSSMHMMTERLKKAGLISMSPKPGFAVPVLEGRSFFYAAFHGSGAFVDSKVLSAMTELDKMIFKSKLFKDGSFVLNAIDPALSAWKVGMTIMRPGHHVRNALSNAYIAFADQGVRNLVQSGYKAQKLLALREGDRGLAQMGEVERLLSGEAASGLKGASGSEVAFSVKTRGRHPKKIKFTFDDLNDAFGRRGMFRTYQQSEDVIEGAGKIQKIADTAMARNTKFGQAMGGLSEALDHHGYVQHAMQIMMNEAKHLGTKYKTLDDLYDYAVGRSFRFHPDSSVLTPAELEVHRRLFPFYTWFKGTLPAVLESTLTHPGRALVAPKASFNIGQMFGVESESIANPWPEDADAPEYLREKMYGPNLVIGDQMYTLDPGFAHTELLKMFFGRGPEDEDGNYGAATLSNIGRELINMLNPFMKVPIELASGREMATGREIYSSGDHIDKAIPYISYATSGTGISFTDNLLHPLSAIAQGRPHEISNVDRGYQNSIFDEGLGAKQYLKVLNMLLGQSAQQVDTEAQSKELKKLRNERLDAREEAGLKAERGSFGGKSGGGSGSSSQSSAEALENLVLPKAASTPDPAALDVGAVGAIEALLQGGGKELTASQRLSAAKAIQEDALRRQGATYSSDYAQNNLSALQQANPQLSLNDLLKLSKELYKDPYR